MAQVDTATTLPPGTKRTGALASGPRKKYHTHHEHYDATVTLTGGDLEKIADTVTMATEDKWALIMAQWKAGVDYLQENLCALQIKMDHPPPSEGQAPPLSVDSNLAQIREASRL